jgi:hypothetical protein
MVLLTPPIDPTSSLVSDQVSTAIIAAFLIQGLKKIAKLPWISYESGRANRVFSIIVAAATGSGISFVWNPQLGQLVLTGITWAVAYHIIGHVIQQFALQHASYKVLIAPPLPGPTQEAIRKNGKNGEIHATN